MNDFKYNIGNCGPTALTNLAYLYKCMGKNMLYNNDIYQTYNKIVESTGKEVGITNKEAMDGFKKYANNYTSYKANIFDYWWDWWSYFKSDIKNGDPVLVHIEGSTSKEPLVGHLIVAYGWIEYAALVIPGNKFLIVADGWYNNGIRVLNFDHYNVINGMRVRI